MSSNCDRLQEWQGNMTEKEKCLRTHLNTSYGVLRSGKGHKKGKRKASHGYFLTVSWIWLFYMSYKLHYATLWISGKEYFSHSVFCIDFISCVMHVLGDTPPHSSWWKTPNRSLFFASSLIITYCRWSLSDHFFSSFYKNRILHYATW